MIHYEEMRAKTKEKNKERNKIFIRCWVTRVSFLLIVVVNFVCFIETFLLHSPSYPQTPNPLASAFHMLGLQKCVTMAGRVCCFFVFHCCVGWGYIVGFTKVLTMYHIYHTGIHPLHHSPLSSSSPFLK
jgi:hypothetical protein